MNIYPAASQTNPEAKPTNCDTPSIPTGKFGNRISKEEKSIDTMIPKAQHLRSGNDKPVRAVTHSSSALLALFVIASLIQGGITGCIDRSI